MILISDLTQDEEIYPRQRLSQKTIDLYAERLKEGIQLPPVEIQRVSVDGEVKLIIIDGVHRVEAYRKNNEKEIDFYHWKEDKVFDKAADEDWIELKLHAAEVNLKHGDRLIEPDTKKVAIDITERDPRFSEVELAKRLGKSVGTISEWVGDIKRRYEASQDNVIFRLHLLGWTQEEIGKVKGVELDQANVSRRLCEFSELKTRIKDSFAKRKSIAEIAKYHNIDETLVWALVLQELSDEDRFETLGFSPRVYNVWNFAGLDEEMGQRYRGGIPGQIVLNTLFYYTKPNDLVIDPMGGGGTTNDACLLLGRRCRSYDVKPVRVDIEKYDIRQGFPPRANKCHLIFLDPPYWNLMDEYYSPESVSKSSYDGWLEFMHKLADDCWKTVKPGGFAALILEASVDERGDKKFRDLPFDCFKFFETVGFNEIHRISVPVTTQVKSHRDVEYAQRNKFLLDINRDLMIFQKL